MTALALVREDRVDDDGRTEQISLLFAKAGSGVRTKGAQEALRGLRMHVAELEEAAQEGAQIRACVDLVAGREGALDLIREMEQARAEGMARGLVFAAMERQQERLDKMVGALRTIAKVIGVDDEPPPPGKMRYVRHGTWGRPEYVPDTRSELGHLVDAIRSEEPDDALRRLVVDVEKLAAENADYDKTVGEQEAELEEWRNTPDAASVLAEKVLAAIGAETFDEDVDLYDIRRAAEDVLQTWASPNRIPTDDATSKREHERIQKRLDELRKGCGT